MNSENELDLVALGLRLNHNMDESVTPNSPCFQNNFMLINSRRGRRSYITSMSSGNIGRRPVLGPNRCIAWMQRSEIRGGVTFIPDSGKQRVQPTYSCPLNARCSSDFLIHPV